MNGGQKGQYSSWQVVGVWEWNETVPFCAISTALTTSVLRRYSAQHWLANTAREHPAQSSRVSSGERGVSNTTQRVSNDPSTPASASVFINQHELTRRSGEQAAPTRRVGMCDTGSGCLRPTTEPYRTTYDSNPYWQREQSALIQAFSSDFANFPIFAPTRLSPTSVEWALPIRADVGLLMIDIADTGLYVLQILAYPQLYNHNSAAGHEYLTTAQIAAAYSRVTGETAGSRVVPLDPHSPQETSFRWFNEFAYYAGEEIEHLPTLPLSQLTVGAGDWQDEVDGRSEEVAGGVEADR